ncbi:UBP-type zinc finger domain-containing protein [Actinacidiphila alni]|uniref:UBP-type zinc finger domain-containing protein n=1 Tax=Actinacidiphila alni TaxID=380248 RepID=UPI003456EE1A
MTTTPGIDPTAAPSGPGCADCDAGGGWWLHLRRCAQCGHIGCCDSSPAQHASAHSKATGHPVMRSYEPGEDWFWDFTSDQYVETDVALAPPQSHPEDQPVPGPAGRVPDDWRSRLN